MDISRFYQACNPSPLKLGNPQDQKYYIDLFTGHIGCGKSTELQRLKAELEKQGCHVVYFESSQVLEMADVDVTDILLAIARSVAESLEAVKIRLQPAN